ncbi:MAG: lipoate--protein ligase family protein [Candidatus Thorarchaeota archaeon]|jgi:lipoate-protein ligase A
MEEVRFLDIETNDAYTNMAIDESIMLAVKEGDVPPTLRLYRWNPSAVSIGTFQGMTEEVDLDFCENHEIDYIRRITGGGAVFHDYEGEITYSIILPRGHRLALDDILESYRLLCGGVVKGLELLGIEAEFKPINDVIAGGKKVSGNAQTRRHSCVLQHGTTLLDLDVETMFSVLKVPQEKISDKMIADVKERVTSVRDLLGRPVTFDELGEALEVGFAKALGVELVHGDLTKNENQTLEHVKSERYENDEWNLKR